MKLSSKLVPLWRGLTVVFLSLMLASITLLGVARAWRTTVDGLLGMSSYKIVTDPQEGADYFKSDFNTAEGLIDQHMKLGEQISEEGSVLLKNTSNALPLGASPKVTLLGVGSYWPLQGGGMGSSNASNSNRSTTFYSRNLVDALTERGFSINPTMKTVYDNIGQVGYSETAHPWTGIITITGTYRPGVSPSGNYKIAEANPTLYTDAEAGKAGVDYKTSFTQYNTAIVTFSRPGAEGGDFYPGEGGLGTDDAVRAANAGTTYNNILGLTKNEKDVLSYATDNFDKVIVLINSTSAMEIDEIKKNDKVQSILWIGFPGNYGFLGLADLLKGTDPDGNRVSPSGHLVDTYSVVSTSSPAAMNFGNFEYTNTGVVATDATWIEGAKTATQLQAAKYVVESESIYTGYKYYETRYYDSVAGEGTQKTSAKSTKGSSFAGQGWDYTKEVSYSFGYGESYTQFEQTLVSVRPALSNKKVEAVVRVKNAGSYPAKSVVQLYVQTPYTQYDKTNLIEKSAIEFIGMTKSEVLAPGTTKEYTISVDMKYLASYDSKAAKTYILDYGTYYFAIANGAHEAVNNVLAKQGKGVSDGMDKAGNAAAVLTWDYTGDGDVDKVSFSKSDNGTAITNQLDDADINYYLDAGKQIKHLSRSDWDTTYPITYSGTNALTIEGAKASEWINRLRNNTYTMKTDGNLDDLRFTEVTEATALLFDKMGKVELTDKQWDDLIDQIPLETLYAKILMGGGTVDQIAEIKNPVVYQNDGPNGFASALGARYAEGRDDEGFELDKDSAEHKFVMSTTPNPPTVAATFNKELAYEFGCLLGNDGLWSGNFTIWGVGANLHRTPYNGRNHEYYSEDAMLANYMGTETVKGALEYGIIVGPKHFAFNDQETNRQGIAPYMTEQKAREGELRAFQGAFEEGGALGAMTTFSRIGATLGNGHEGLLLNILRGEWGFKGILSTDLSSYRGDMLIYHGVTMAADFGSNETFTDPNNANNRNTVTYKYAPYITSESILKDPTLAQAAKRNMKWQLYALANSAALNVYTIQVMPAWETGLIAAVTTTSILTGLLAATYIVFAVLGKKKEA